MKRCVVCASHVSVTTEDKVCIRKRCQTVYDKIYSLGLEPKAFHAVVPRTKLTIALAGVLHVDPEMKEIFIDLQATAKNNKEKFYIRPLEYYFGNSSKNAFLGLNKESAYERLKELIEETQFTPKPKTTIIRLTKQGIEALKSSKHLLSKKEQRIYKTHLVAGSGTLSEMRTLFELMGMILLPAFYVKHKNRF